MELTNSEMYEVSGGAISWKIMAGIVSGLIFIVGFVSGYTNPTRCSN